MFPKVGLFPTIQTSPPNPYIKKMVGIIFLLFGWNITDVIMTSILSGPLEVMVKGQWWSHGPMSINLLSLTCQVMSLVLCCWVCGQNYEGKKTSFM